MKRQITAAELMARLNADPDFTAQKKDRDEAFQRKHEESVRAEIPLVGDLNAAGVPVTSVWDLVNRRNAYPQSLPILLDHLQRPYPDEVRDGIARAMAIPDARFAWRSLVELYQKEQGSRTQQGLSVALSNIADDGMIDEIVALVRNPQLGASRVLMIEALGRSRLPVAREALTEFLNDPFLQKEAQKALRRMKRKRA